MNLGSSHGVRLEKNDDEKNHAMASVAGAQNTKTKISRKEVSEYATSEVRLCRQQQHTRYQELDSSQ